MFSVGYVCRGAYCVLALELGDADLIVAPPQRSDRRHDRAPFEAAQEAVRLLLRAPDAGAGS